MGSIGLHTYIGDIVVPQVLLKIGTILLKDYLNDEPFLNTTLKASSD